MSQTEQDPAERGRLVHERRAERKLTQEELARLCCCSPRTIQRIERGQHPATHKRILAALGKHLGIDARELARGA